MQPRTIRTLAATFAVGAAVFVSVPITPRADQNKPLSRSSLTPLQRRLLSGAVSTELDMEDILKTARPEPLLFAPVQHAPNYFPSEKPEFGPDSIFSPGAAGKCNTNFGSNVEVNQDCLNLTDSDLQGRGQAKNTTSVAQDPNQPSHLVSAHTDYRLGDGRCVAEFSLDSGNTWADSIIPVDFTRGLSFCGVAREYWQTSTDTSVAWDTKGNAYLACLAFVRGSGVTNNPDLSSAVYVFRSTGNQGASWNFTGRPVVESYGVVPGAALEDKSYMTVDNHVGSTFQDRVYVTWTEFSSDGSAYIWESHSDNFGESFSPRVLVSRNNTTLCVNTFGAGTTQGNCNANQFSQPFTGRDGSLYVVWDNFNNSTSSASDNHNQVLLAKSTDGGASFNLPVLVANYYDLPDCSTFQGQNFGRSCVPEQGAAKNSVFRASNYPSGAVNPNNASQVVVSFGSYINIDSKEPHCTPAGVSSSGNTLFTGVKAVPGCNNKILVSVSNNGGRIFTGQTINPRSLTTVNQAPGQAASDQFFQWAAFASEVDSGQFVVSYYDRQYGNNRFSGNMDVSVSVSEDLLGFSSSRVTTSSMPLPTQFPDSSGNSVFFGDYSGLSVGGQSAHPVWMDTRNSDLFLCPDTGERGEPPAVCTATEHNGLKANTQEIYTTNVGVQ